MKHEGERKTGNDRTRKYQAREIFSFRDIMSFKVKGLNAKKKKKKPKMGKAVNEKRPSEESRV